MPTPAFGCPIKHRINHQLNYQINYQIPNLPNYQLQVFA